MYFCQNKKHKDCKIVFSEVTLDNYFYCWLQFVYTELLLGWFARSLRRWEGSASQAPRWWAGKSFKLPWKTLNHEGGWRKMCSFYFIKSISPTRHVSVVCMIFDRGNITKSKYLNFMNKNLPSFSWNWSSLRSWINTSSF